MKLAKLKQVRPWALTFIASTYGGEFLNYYYWTTLTLLGKTLTVCYLLTGITITITLILSYKWKPQMIIPTMIGLQVKIALFLINELFDPEQIANDISPAFMTI